MKHGQPSLLQVAVSQRIDYHSERKEWRDSIDERLVLWLRGIRALAFPVPNPLSQEEDLQAWLRELQPDAVLLSGGNDIGEFSQRDATEMFLMDYAAKQRLPLLGICRGMQMMAHYAGVRLSRVFGHAGSFHDLTTPVNVNLPQRVNSFHDWGLTSCPQDYEVLAQAPDGSIEAFAHRFLPWEGWMWHPERDSIFDPRTILRGHDLLHGVRRA